jgi:hypothetical protein
MNGREAALQKIFEGKKAFMLTFSKLRGLCFRWSKDKAYRTTLSLMQPANILVLEDLAMFCRANETCVVPGDRDRTMVLEGRREVWLHIMQRLHLTPEQLFALYNGDYTKLRS